MKHRLQGFSKGLSKNFCSRFSYTASAEVELLLRAMLCSPARGVGAGCGAWSTSWTATRNRCGQGSCGAWSASWSTTSKRCALGTGMIYAAIVLASTTASLWPSRSSIAAWRGTLERRGAGIWHAHSILVQFGMQKSSPGANFLIGMKARPSTVNLSFFECLWQAISTGMSIWCPWYLVNGL